MSFDAFFTRITERGIKALKDFALDRASTFRIGGICRVAVFPESEAELCEILALARDHGLPFKVIGRGSNCLIYDGRLEMIVIFTKGLRDFRFEERTVFCGAGVSLVALSQAAADAGLGGLEFACGIPGSVGGAVYMNAGAHGGAVSDVLLQSLAFDKERGETVVLTAEEHEFGYRKSAYMRRTELICLGATLQLTRTSGEEIRRVMSENMQKRRATQPVDAFSAGSYFKRPEGDAAGRLIEVCGLKGFSIGGARVSEKHAGFIVNTGGATFEDVIRLEEHIVRTVYQNTGVTLQREVEIIK